MIFQNLLLEKKGPASWITLNRPDVKNAFSLEMGIEFLEVVRRSLKDRSTSVLVVTGHGDAFSAGGDIKKMSETKDLKSFFLKISKLVHQSVFEMKRSEKPVLAAIPGYVGGIAFGMVLGADLRLVSTKAKFCAATIRLGLVANGSATYHLPRMVGLTRAAEILFLGDILSANKALGIGLVNRVVPPEKLLEETQVLAERLAASPRKALGRLKKILNTSLTSSLPAQMERERQAIAWSATTPDFQEGIRAFLEKRPPRYNS